jgi:RNA-directed DNA polymerase
MLTALANGVRGGKWFSLIDKVCRRQTLEAAWAAVQAGNGAAGVDAISCERFAAHADRYLEELRDELETGRYRPQAVRRVDIPKGGGKTRPLGIPTVKDRIVQNAVKRVIEPIFEREFVPGSYGFRPGLGCKDALREVDRLLKAGYTHVVDADLARYFDTIPQERLLLRVADRISDGRLLALLDQWLNQEVVKDLDRWTPTAGTPQGAVISPLLANIYLHDLDQHMAEHGYRMVRYADDFVILCGSAAEAERALERVRVWVTSHGLTLHADKTHVGNCMIPGQGFEFLGYRFEGGRRWVRNRSRNAFRERVRSRTRRCSGQSLERVIAQLNPFLKGWFAYFRHADRLEFPRMDGFVRRRLRSMLRKHAKRPGQGHTPADHRRWPNTFFAEHGLFTLADAHALASQSR